MRIFLVICMKGSIEKIANYEYLIQYGTQDSGITDIL